MTVSEGFEPPQGEFFEPKARVFIAGDCFIAPKNTDASLKPSSSSSQ